MFFGTSIPTTVVILKKNRETRDVLFIDASKDFIKGKSQNKLSTNHIDRVIETYKKRNNVEKYAYVSSFDEIQENDFNLNIPRYVDTFEEEEKIDLGTVGNELKEVREKKAKLEANLYEMISSLQYDEKENEYIQGALEVFGYDD